LLIAGLIALALVIPAPPTERVNDYAGVLAAPERARLEAQLTEREQATGAQMVIAIFKSLEGESLEDYSIRLAQQWRVGQKSLDNGVILLVFLDDRKVRMEVGYGLEPLIPDAVAGRIIRDTMGPHFREQRYAQGLEEAVKAVFARVDTKAAPQARAEPRARPGRSGPSMATIFVIAVIVMLVLHEMRGPGRRASRNAYTAGRRGWYAPAAMFPWFGSGRSGGGWGGGGGGGFGGGGFSGGGGSFGGGGASGSW
jgi:uncharacterized protein